MMQHLLQVPSPAKLNLFLHITGRRQDGYHELQTLFQLLDYGDKLDFELLQTPDIVVEPAFDDIPPEQNLVYKAARSLQQASQTALGARIYLHKQLPMGAGLGGGSSNAATTLLALDRLWSTRLDHTSLLLLAGKLGADVPLFINGHSAWAEGIGEQLTNLTLPENWFVVATPDCHVSTAEIFSNQELTRNTSPIKIAAFPEGATRNDCEAVVCRLYPAVADALATLSRYAPCRMTGTGASVFAQFGTEAEAWAVLQQLPSSLKGFVARGVNTSPLLRFLQDSP